MRGWIGEVDDVMRALESVDADRDPDTGSFIVIGPSDTPPPTYGIGGQEVVLAGEIMYLQDGKRRRLIPLLVKLGYGVEIEVFGAR